LAQQGAAGEEGGIRFQLREALRIERGEKTARDFILAGGRVGAQGADGEIDAAETRVGKLGDARGGTRLFGQQQRE
jgi:hypothetical protein